MAGSNLGELFVEITADTKKFDSAVDATGKKVTGFETGTTKIATSLKKLIGGIGVAVLVAKIGELGKASINAASDAEETSAKFFTAFAGIETKAAETALYLKESYGLSQTESEKLLGATGDLVKGFGANADQALETSTEIQKLSVDLASYNNLQGGASRASEILTKAYLGERDSLISLGIKISDADVKARLLEKGQIGLTGQTLLLAKGQATLELAMIQSGDAIGDFNRTQDSYANKMKVAKARTSDLSVELGRALLPAATGGVGVFADFTAEITKHLKALIDARIVYDSFAKGTETVNDKLFVVKQQITENSVEIDKLELMYDRATDPKFKKRWQDQLTVLYEQNQVARRVASAIQKEIDAAEVLAEVERKAAEEKASADKKAQDAKDKLIKSYVDQNEAVQKVLDANKSEIDQLDEQIEYISKLGLAEGELKEDQKAAIEILQKQKQDIIDEDIAAQKELTDNEIAENKKRVEDYNTYISDKETADKEYANESIKSYGTTAKEILSQAEELANGQKELNLETAASMASAIAEQTGSVEVAAVALGLTFVNAITDTFTDDGSEDWEKALVIALTYAGGIGVGALTSVILSGIRDSNKEVEALINESSLKTTKARLENETALAEQVYDLAVSNAEVIEIEQLAAYVAGLTEKERLALQSAGIIKETNKERIARELQDAIDAGDSELEALKKKEQEINTIKLASLDAQAIARKTYEKEIARIEYEKAKIDRQAQISQAKADKISAVASVPWYESGIFGDTDDKVKKLYNGLISELESIPLPPAPALATGAFVSGSSQGTSVVVGEGGNDEEIFGMGSKGVPRRSKFASEVAGMVMSQMGGGTTNNYYQSLFSTTNPSDLRKFNRINRPYQVAEEQRIGARD